jgi:hypothetical protein
MLSRRQYDFYMVRRAFQTARRHIVPESAAVLGTAIVAGLAGQSIWLGLSGGLATIGIIFVACCFTEPFRALEEEKKKRKEAERLLAQPRRVTVVQERLNDIAQIANRLAARRFISRGRIAQSLWCHVYSVLVKSMSGRQMAALFEGTLSQFDLERKSIAGADVDIIDRLLHHLAQYTRELADGLVESNLSIAFHSANLISPPDMDGLATEAVREEILRFAAAARHCRSIGNVGASTRVYAEARECLSAMLSSGSDGLPVLVEPATEHQVMQWFADIERWMSAKAEALSIQHIREVYLANLRD